VECFLPVEAANHENHHDQTLRRSGLPRSTGNLKKPSAANSRRTILIGFLRSGGFDRHEINGLELLVR